MTNIPRIFGHCAKHSIRSIPARLHSEPNGKYFSPGWTVNGARAAGKARAANLPAPAKEDGFAYSLGKLQFSLLNVFHKPKHKLFTHLLLH